MALLVETPDGFLSEDDITLVKDEDPEAWIYWPTVMYWVWQNRSMIQERGPKKKITVVEYDEYKYGCMGSWG